MYMIWLGNTRRFNVVHPLIRVLFYFSNFRREKQIKLDIERYLPCTNSFEIDFVRYSNNH
jgi:hypothetical protein